MATLTRKAPVAKRSRKRKERSAKCLTLSPRETMEYTGLGERRTYRLLRQGIMPSIPDPDGKGFRIPRSALLEWLHRCQGVVTELPGRDKDG